MLMGYVPLYQCVLSLLPLLFSFRVAHSQELRYALFTSGPTGSFDSSGAVPAIELAEELINADSSILPGYDLTHTPVVDTEVRFCIIRSVYQYRGYHWLIAV